MIKEVGSVCVLELDLAKTYSLESFHRVFHRIFSRFRDVGDANLSCSNLLNGHLMTLSVVGSLLVLDLFSVSLLSYLCSFFLWNTRCFCMWRHEWITHWDCWAQAQGSGWPGLESASHVMVFIFIQRSLPKQPRRPFSRTHAVLPWSCLDACQNQSGQKLNALWPASSLIQRSWNIWLSWCVKRAGNSLVSLGTLSRVWCESSYKIMQSICRASACSQSQKLMGGKQNEMHTDHSSQMEQPPRDRKPLQTHTKKTQDSKQKQKNGSKDSLCVCLPVSAACVQEWWGLFFYFQFCILCTWVFLLDSCSRISIYLSAATVTHPFKPVFFWSTAEVILGICTLTDIMLGSRVDKRRHLEWFEAKSTVQIWQKIRKNTLNKEGKTNHSSHIHL